MFRIEALKQWWVGGQYQWHRKKYKHIFNIAWWLVFLPPCLAFLLVFLTKEVAVPMLMLGLTGVPWAVMVTLRLVDQNEKHVSEAETGE